ncbi:MAG: hypothetical protein ACU0B5_03535 [Roseovarius sp.]
MHVIPSNVPIVAARKVAGSWLDSSPSSAYLLRMRRLSSILLLAFLAVFSVSNIAHAMSANDMALDMAAMDGGAMALEDCQGCPTDDEGAADRALCQLDCTAPGAMALTAAASFEYMMPALRHDRPLSVSVPHGLRAPPDPFPPRPLI